MSRVLVLTKTQSVTNVTARSTATHLTLLEGPSQKTPSFLITEKSVFDRD